MKESHFICCVLLLTAGGFGAKTLNSAMASECHGYPAVMRRCLEVAQYCCRFADLLYLTYTHTRVTGTYIVAAYFKTPMVLCYRNRGQCMLLCSGCGWCQVSNVFFSHAEAKQGKLKVYLFLLQSGWILWLAMIGGKE